MCVKSVDKCGGLTRQKVDSDNEKMNKDENSGNSNQAGLENESAKEINIKSNRSIGAGDSCKLDDLKAEVGLLLLVIRNSGSDKTEGKEINLIDFNELDLMSERKPESILEVFIEGNLINFGYVEGELVINDYVKEEIIKEANSETFGWSRCIGDVDGINKVVNCFQDGLSDVDVATGIKEMVKDLKALIDYDFNECNCSMDLSKWHWYMNFKDLDGGNKDEGNSMKKKEDGIEVMENGFVDNHDERAAVYADRINDDVVDCVVEDRILDNAGNLLHIPI
ncbi:hypothetical protein C2G38_2173910 [Gigaspora rosea]|uniref:Uncharacterized protein n=1 Tax=Gigaspora rosea TaxID=44941 RepID=A0A397VKW2_9GLOM|nr:hypothetical protein C2G38_2173910 [Gigaspora rosea]